MYCRGSPYPFSLDLTPTSLFRQKNSVSDMPILAIVFGAVLGRIFLMLSTKNSPFNEKLCAPVQPHRSVDDGVTPTFSDSDLEGRVSFIM